jgi:hypothetical protein
MICVSDVFSCIFQEAERSGKPGRIKSGIEDFPGDFPVRDETGFFTFIQKILNGGCFGAVCGATTTTIV